MTSDIIEHRKTRHNSYQNQVQGSSQWSWIRISFGQFLRSYQKAYIQSPSNQCRASLQYTTTSMCNDC
jgi:hypothetical protein